MDDGVGINVTEGVGVITTVESSWGEITCHFATVFSLSTLSLPIHRADIERKSTTTVIPMIIFLTDTLFFICHPFPSYPLKYGDVV